MTPKYGQSQTDYVSKHSIKSRVCLGLMGVQRALEAMLLRSRGYQPRTITSSIGPVHAWIGPKYGEGPIWFFFHGIVSEASHWSRMLAFMEQHCGQVVLVDAPGHGHSPIPSGGQLTYEVFLEGCRAVVDAFRGDAELVLIGNSMGGYIALRLALELGSSVKALGLISPAGSPMTEGEFIALLKSFSVDSTQQCLAFADRIYPDGAPIFPGRITFAMVAQAHIKQAHFQHFFQAAPQMPVFAQGELARISCPTLLIWGGRDHILPPSGGFFLKSELSSSQTKFLFPPNYSHTPFMDAPQELARDLMSWARGVPGLLLSEDRQEKRHHGAA